MENAAFALGFKRYGLDAQLEQLVTGMFDAVAHFRSYRLPEALGGHGREETPVLTVRTWLLDRAPGRLASALRLALGVT